MEVIRGPPYISLGYRIIYAVVLPTVTVTECSLHTVLMSSDIPVTGSFNTGFAISLVAIPLWTQLENLMLLTVIT